MPRTLPSLLRCGRALLEAVPVDHVLGAGEQRVEVAGVVNLSGRRRVGHRLRLDEVAAADHVRRDIELARRGIDQPLDQIRRFGAARAAIGIDRHGVGVGRAQPNERSRDVIDAGRHAGAEPRNVRRVTGQIRAHVGDDVDIEREKFALLVERQRRGGDVVAAVAVADEMLDALADPAHRLAELAAATAASAYSR